jgi:hypothetical protein
LNFKSVKNSALILGAGASNDAGIPLMNDFVQCMWEISRRGRWLDTFLPLEDQNIFRRAIEVTNELDQFHGRAMFDDRNIEDILSILSFNVVAGKKKDKDKLKDLTRAIARTIELTCTVKHDGRLHVVQDEGPTIYPSFWQALFKWYESSRQLPTIITFNYDLVLERSLFQVLINNKIYNPDDCHVPFRGMEIDYHYNCFPIQRFKVLYDEYFNPRNGRSKGTKLVKCDEFHEEGTLHLDILKLHGSLNFRRPHCTNTKQPSLVDPVKDPFILPPIFNKLSSSNPQEIWREALIRLMSTKNIVFIGYSLPRTDINMQYFLKAAIGPNIDLNRISVFDPVLFREDADAKDMRDRFGCCFSPQIQNRINFQPSIASNTPLERKGKLSHFVQLVWNDPKEIFF